MNNTVRKPSDFGCEVSKNLFTKESHHNLPVRKLEGQDMATYFWMRLPFVCPFPFLLAGHYLQWQKIFTGYIETDSIHSNAEESNKISKLRVFCLTSWFPRAPDLIYRDKVSGKTPALSVGDLDDPPGLLPLRVWACSSTAKSSNTDRAMWDLHLDGAVWRRGIKMHPKYGFFSRKSWPSCKTPMAQESILADFQSINLYPDKMERWREGC